MSLERRGTAWAAVMGAGLAAALLGVWSAGDGGVLLGVGVGVAVVGAVRSVGMLGVAYVADIEGEPPYLSPATTASASVLLLVATDAHAPGGEPPAVSVALAGAAVLLVVGPALIFASEFRRSQERDGA